MTILVVDDVDFSRTILREVLASAGYRIVEAENGVEALKALETEAVDLIISDLLMPKMDGLRLCTELRKRKETKDTPFIIYTGTLTTPNDEEMAREYGADFFFRKPVSMDVLLEKLQSVVAQRGAVHHSVLPATGEIEKTSQYSDLLIKKLEERNFELEAILSKQGEELIRVLEKAERLYSLLPICPNCKKSRVDERYWKEVRTFIEDLPGSQITDGICIECGREVHD
ncbi:MAG TPA: response regulator [Bacteroidota bacterium]|jgi:CheY-like chemotaxis protein|nr:response regulator [Bacteroidota bacterium]